MKNYKKDNNEYSINDLIQKKREKDELKEQLKRKELESYTDLMSYDSMSSNRESEMTEEDFEASFM